MYQQARQMYHHHHHDHGIIIIMRVRDICWVIVCIIKACRYLVALSLMVSPVVMVTSLVAMVTVWLSWSHVTIDVVVCIPCSVVARLNELETQDRECYHNNNKLISDED